MQQQVGRPKVGIPLLMDMANVSFLDGAHSAIADGPPEDYVSVVHLILPETEHVLPIGKHQVEMDGLVVELRVSQIDSAESDPIAQMGAGMHLGAPGTGVDSLPLVVFTDNKGQYPCLAATVIFPYRIATWANPNYPAGMDHDYEAAQITGPPHVSEKIVALKVVNRLAKSMSAPGITYDQVTAFVEYYYRKDSYQPLVRKLTVLASSNAYRNAVEEHFLGGFDRQALQKASLNLEQTNPPGSIESENDLLVVVEQAIADVLTHHIENRRWVEAFWDGDRTLHQAGEKVTVPRSPKGEVEIQPTLHVVLDLALHRMGIQVIRESYEGVGSLDFRCLYTTKDNLPLTVGIEFKLAHHKEIRKGIRRQLPAYLKAIRSNSGIFSVMWFKDESAKYFSKPKDYQKDSFVEWLTAEANTISADNKITVRSSVIDASIKPSASVLKA